MKLWKDLKNKPFCNQIHFLLVAVLLLLLVYHYHYFVIILIGYLIYLLKDKYIFIFSIFLMLIIVFLLMYQNSKKIDLKESYELTISDVYDDRAILKYKNVKIIVWDSLDYLPGDVINCSLEFSDLDDKSYQNDFEYKLYLKSLGISYQAKITNIEYVKTVISFKRIKNLLLNYLKDKLSSDSFLYVEAMIFQNNNFDDDLKNGYNVLGISHILAISGLHIMLIYKIIAFILLKFLKLYSEVISITIIFIYCLILGFPYSCLRAFLFLFFKFLNKKGYNHYTRLDIFSLSLLFMLFFNPYRIYNLGLILSFLVSFFLIFKNDIIKIKNSFLNLYLTSICIYFLTLPIVLSFNYEISLFAIMFAPIITILISYIVLPITYLLAIIPVLDGLLRYLYLGLNSYILNLKQMALIIKFGSFNILQAFIYYIIFYLVVISSRKNKYKYFLLMSLYLFFINNIKLINPYNLITFIDVGQGDSTLIELSHNRGTMLIDAYNCIDFLKSKGIKKIDYLILTHSDDDHIKQASEIIDYYNVKNIMIPYYDDGFNIEGCRLRKGDYFYLDDVRVNIIAPIRGYEDNNSNSLVLKFNIDGYSFLFTGDMTIQEEDDLIKSNINLKSNVLKVGHHGSKTSSQKDFIRFVNPDYSVISVKRDNYYGLPDLEVVSLLEQTSTVLQTKDCGNIEFYIYDNVMKVKPYR